MDCTFNTKQNKTERKTKKTAPSSLLEKPWEEDACLNPGMVFSDHAFNQDGARGDKEK